MIQTFLQAHADSDCSGRDAVLRPYGSAPTWIILTLMGLAFLPFAAALLASLASAVQLSAWREMWADPQLPKALGLTLWSATCATLLAIVLSTVILAKLFPGPTWDATTRRLPALLALPHLAFAIGCVFLIAPSGWLIRVVSPWLTGFEQPPLWTTSQDPWGLGLIGVLGLKEVPFLLWAASSQLARPEIGQRLRAQWWVAQTMGYSPRSAWWRVIAPEVWQRLFWPVFAVWAYSISVVDVAMVIGPTTPPTASVLATQWLQDPDLAINHKGSALAWLILLMMVAVLLAGKVALGLAVKAWGRSWITNGPKAFKEKGLPSVRRRSTTKKAMTAKGWSVRLIITLPYAAVTAALVVGSVAGYWPFPMLWPASFSLQGWQSVAQSSSTLLTTLTLALACGLSALVLAVAWLEWGARMVPAWGQAWVYLPLVVPPLLWVGGMYHIALWTQTEGQWMAVYLSHLLFCVPYALIALSPTYRDFDVRYGWLAASLGVSYARFLWVIKWPMLKAAMASTAALAFAVSVAQYLPTQFMGVGRLTTVTTEAVTLAAGAQRDLSAAFALLQCVLPLLALALAHLAGRPRRWRQPSIKT